MASSTTNGINRGTKANLSVASLINCSPKLPFPGSPASSVEKTKTEVVITTVINNAPKNLPTVANSDLLYKTVSSSVSSPQTIQPSSSATSSVNATLTVNYTLNPSFVSSYGAITNSNPLTNIKALTNVVTNPRTKIEVNHQYQSKKPYVQIRPAPIAPANHIIKSSVSPNKNNINFALAAETNLGSSIMTTNCKTPLVVFSTSPIVSASIPSATSPSKLKTIVAKPVQPVVAKSNNSETKAVFVPRGWNRILEKEYITYVSPNKSRLRSMEDLLDYLQEEGTCKCGLECPFKPSEVFDFNPKVQSRFGFSANGKTDPNREIHCNVCRKFEELFPPAPKSKPSRGRRPGVKNKRSLSSEDSKPSPERKKILLTGASPLELFQTKMLMDTSSSSAFINFAPPRKDATLQRSHSVPASSFTNISNNTPTTDKSSLDIAAEEIINANKIQEKRKATRGRGRGCGGNSSVAPSFRKALPNAVVHNARDLQLKDILSQVSQNHIATTKHVLINQLQGLLGGHPTTDLKEISKALSALQNKQSTTINEQTSSISHSNDPLASQKTIEPNTQANNSILYSSSSNFLGSVTSGLPKISSSSPVIPSLPTQMTSKTNPSPLHLLSQNIVNNTNTQQQQMLLLQLVSQSRPTTSNTIATHPYAQTTSPTILQNLAVQKSQTLTTNVVDGTVQIKGLVPIATQTQVSPISLPVQYVVNPPAGFSIQKQPIVQYVTQNPTPIQHTSSKTSKTSTLTTNYVRIAPAATQTTVVERISPLEQEKQKQEREFLSSMQEHFSEKNLNTQNMYEILPGARDFLSDVASKRLKSPEEENPKAEEEATEVGHSINDEMLLHCDESVCDRDEQSKEEPPPPLLDHGVVWVHLPGFPTWPAKIMTYIELKKPKLDDGEHYVSMYLTHQVHVVTQAQLKPFDERTAKEKWGVTIDSVGKDGSDLEKAIQQALLDISSVA